MLKYLCYLICVLFLNSCAWLQKNPQAEKELEVVSEEVAKDVIEVVL